MSKSNRLKLKPVLFTVFIVISGITGLCFTPGMSAPDWLSWSNRCLMQCFNAAADTKLKKWELTITDNSFVRLRKTYVNGKQEYYSFHLHRFSDMDYLGNTTGGNLQLKTIADDIIVQTYNDPKGNVDSMATSLTIPVRNMEPERLDSLQDALAFFKDKQ